MKNLFLILLCISQMCFGAEPLYGDNECCVCFTSENLIPCIASGKTIDNQYRHFMGCESCCIKINEEQSLKKLLRKEYFFCSVCRGITKKADLAAALKKDAQEREERDIVPRLERALKLHEYLFKMKLEKPQQPADLTDRQQQAEWHKKITKYHGEMFYICFPNYERVPTNSSR